MWSFPVKTLLICLSLTWTHLSSPVTELIVEILDHAASRQQASSKIHLQQSHRQEYYVYTAWTTHLQFYVYGSLVQLLHPAGTGWETEMQGKGGSAAPAVGKATYLAVSSWVYSTLIQGLYIGSCRGHRYTQVNAQSSTAHTESLLAQSMLHTAELSMHKAVFSTTCKASFQRTVWRSEDHYLYIHTSRRLVLQVPEGQWKHKVLQLTMHTRAHTFQFACLCYVMAHWMGTLYKASAG